MEIIFRKSFQKDFDKLIPKLQITTEQRVNMFSKNPYDPAVRLHKLKGEWNGYHSIDISADLRAIFYLLNNHAIFVRIGTHSQLYK